jgi:hypothetical protein
MLPLIDIGNSSGFDATHDVNSIAFSPLRSRSSVAEGEDDHGDDGRNRNKVSDFESREH